MKRFIVAVIPSTFVQATTEKQTPTTNQIITNQRNTQEKIQKKNNENNKQELFDLNRVNERQRKREKGKNNNKNKLRQSIEFRLQVQRVLIAFYVCFVFGCTEIKEMSAKKPNKTHWKTFLIA